MPKPLKIFLMTLIPKLMQAKLPNDFRPIAIGSLIRRIFSGILIVIINELNVIINEY